MKPIKLLQAICGHTGTPAAVLKVLTEMKACQEVINHFAARVFKTLSEDDFTLPGSIILVDDFMKPDEKPSAEVASVTVDNITTEFDPTLFIGEGFRDQGLGENPPLLEVLTDVSRCINPSPRP